MQGHIVFSAIRKEKKNVVGCLDDRQHKGKAGHGEYQGCHSHKIITTEK